MSSEQWYVHPGWVSQEHFKQCRRCHKPMTTYWVVYGDDKKYKLCGQCKDRRGNSLSYGTGEAHGPYSTTKQQQ